jgi:hypothetical protein
VAASAGLLTRETLAAALRVVLAEAGVAPALASLQALMALGFEHARGTGASLSPFAGEGLRPVAAPAGAHPDAWRRLLAERMEELTARTDYDEPDLSPQVLAIKSGARGQAYHLLRLTGPESQAHDERGRPVQIWRGWRDGLTPAELFARAADTRIRLHAINRELVEAEGRRYGGHGSFTVLARAARSDYPGFVFAHAAATGEADPLTDLDSRLFVGLPAAPSVEGGGRD